MVEYRLRLKEEEIIALRRGLLREVAARIKEKMDWEEYEMLRHLYDRLSRAGKVRGGAPGKICVSWNTRHDDKKKYEAMTDWLEWRIKRFAEGG